MDTLIRTGSDGAPRDGCPERPRQPTRGEAVVIVDVDQFAAIRAAHGPMAAEQVTRAVADCLRRRLRTGDRLALLREDEFLAVLTGASECSVQAIAGRMREGIELTRMSLAEYGARHRHWGLAWSGGKDSTALVTLITWMLE